MPDFYQILEIVGRRRDFLLDNIDDYVNAIYDGNGSAWLSNMLARYIAKFPYTVLDERTWGTHLHHWSVETLQTQLERWMDANGCGVAKVGYSLDKDANAALETIREVADAIGNDVSPAVTLNNASVDGSIKDTESTKSMSEEVTNSLSLVDAQIASLHNSSPEGSAMKEEAEEILAVIDANIAKLQTRYDQLRKERDDVRARALELWVESIQFMFVASRGPSDWKTIMQNIICH
ncbi:hypothetical protein ARMGADRAFT_1022569 [Armillaria gallica]|uniref:Uncharacterized protein n=1 Tax=Armillaria gallica TaxID=47427 RepID=A0A2H3ELH6_ARMGA|nr:hypothetical protein ARMGADRAFT_1022569 [Armillaria gallica]